MIELQDVSVRLGGSLVLDRVSTTFRAGEFTCLVGPNGAGKTTLLRALAGLAPYRGEILIEGVSLDRLPPRERARRVAYLPQGHVAHWPIPACEAVAVGRMPHGGGPGLNRPHDDAVVQRAMLATGVAMLSNRPVTELSGGERARVMLARALAVEAPVLVADEPTAALDPAHQLGVLALLCELAETGGVVIAALHDLTLATRFADRAVVLDRGRLVADGPPSQVLDAALLASVFGIEATRFEHDGRTLVVPWLPQADLHR